MAYQSSGTVNITMNSKPEPLDHQTQESKRNIESHIKLFDCNFWWMSSFSIPLVLYLMQIVVSFHHIDNSFWPHKL